MAASDPVTALLNIGGAVIDRLWPDPIKANEAKLELYRLEKSGELEELKATTSLALAQANINAEEAKSSSVFVSGWRPWAGWVAGTGFAYAVLFEPLLRFIATVGFSYSGAYPAIDTNLTLQLLFGMLGLGGLRSFDKKNGVASK